MGIFYNVFAEGYSSGGGGKNSSPFEGNPTGSGGIPRGNGKSPFEGNPTGRGKRTVQRKNAQRLIGNGKKNV